MDDSSSAWEYELEEPRDRVMIGRIGLEKYMCFSMGEQGMRPTIPGDR